MSDTKPRTAADVQGEYNNLAFKAGNLEYDLRERRRNLDMVYETMRTLATEWLSLKAAEEAAAQAAKPPVKEADAGLGSAPTEAPKAKPRAPRRKAEAKPEGEAA